MMRITTTLLVLLSWFVAHGQVLISSGFLGEMSTLQLKNQYGYDFRSAIKMYGVTYATTGSNGLPDTASGLVIIPFTRYKGKLSVIAYQHGTTNGPDDVPSTLGSGSDEPKVYGGMGYVVAAADYLGLGASRGFHPYVHRATEASAAVDLLRATRELLNDQTGEWDFDYLFVSGYSQGGHGAMGLAQELEENHFEEFPLTASTPMSGPYDISGTMFDLIVSDEVYFFSGYIPYTVMGYQEVYGNLYSSLDEVFKPDYIPGIESFYNREINLTELTTFLFINLLSDAGSSIPKYMFDEDYLEAVENDPQHPLRVALRDNNTYNWTPSAPMRLYYCTADDQVSYLNSIVADSILRENGATDLVTLDVDPDADHGGCVRPAFEQSQAFFDSFVQTSAAKSPVYANSKVAFPNPAGDYLQLSPEFVTGGQHVHLYDVKGSVVKSLNGSQSYIDLGGLPSGMYFLQLQNENGVYSQKIYVE